MSGAREITAALGGKWFNGYGMAPCPVHGNRSAALKISDSQERRDGIDVHCFTGCSWQAVKAQLAVMGLIDSDGCSSAIPVDPAIIQARREAERQRRAERGRTAQWIWESAIPADQTIARYLTGRGIALVGLPDALRVSLTAKHPASDQRFRAMVAAMVDASGALIATHSTYLDPRGAGKAGIDPDKIIIGNPIGAAVRLTPIPADGVLGVAEGIETALAAHELHQVPTWATGNTSLLMDFIPPPDIRHVVIFADFDQVNKTGKRPGTVAAKALAMGLHDAGIGWEIRYPSSGFKDFADELLTRKRERAA